MEANITPRMDCTIVNVISLVSTIATTLANNATAKTAKMIYPRVLTFSVLKKRELGTDESSSCADSVSGWVFPDDIFIKEVLLVS